MRNKTVIQIALLLFTIVFIFHFYAKKQPTVLRGSDADWTYLGLAVMYAVLLTALFYLLTDYVLKKKRYV